MNRDVVRPVAVVALMLTMISLKGVTDIVGSASPCPSDLPCPSSAAAWLSVAASCDPPSVAAWAISCSVPEVPPRPIARK